MASKATLSDSESVDWHHNGELLSSVTKFHDTYAMPPEKLECMKPIHEYILHNFFNYLGFCETIRKIGGSYEGVKVVKSKENDDFEFDVMFVMKIPGDTLEIVKIPERPGYAKLLVKNGQVNHEFFARCITFEDGMWMVDAGKTTAAFFGKLQKWINTKPVPGLKLLPRQHGTAIQMDVIYEDSGGETIAQNKLFYSVDIAPTFEIVVGEKTKRYVTKPERKRSPDSVTWRRLFDPGKCDSDMEKNARAVLRSSVDELCKQLSECQSSITVIEAARICTPLSLDDILKIQAALVQRKSCYRLTSVDLKDINRGTNKRLVAVGYPHDKELDVLPVPEKSGYAWLKFGEEASDRSSVNNALKLCYLPGGKYLDIKAASDLLVKELQNIANDLFKDRDVIVRRIGPNVRIDVYPEKGNAMLYHYLDIILAALVDGNFYTGLPDDYDDAPETKAWRRSYSYEESEKIQQAPEGLRKVFRVLKAIRNDEPGLAQLTSYHFKTLLLNMQKLQLINWTENIDKILISVLKYLKDCLSEKELPTLDIPDINLMHKMINDCMAHMTNRIDQLLTNKQKMLKALKETTDEVLQQLRNESALPFWESFSMQGSSGGILVASPLLFEIDRQLFGYDYQTITSKPVYKDLTVYRICPREVPFLIGVDAIMLVSNNRSNLRACRYNERVIRLERCNSTVSNSLLNTVSHNSGLADTRMTAEFIKQQLDKLISQSSFLSVNVHVQVEGSNIVLQSRGSDLRLNILPGYEVGEGIFIAMPDVPGTSSWMPIPFTPVRNKTWNAFQISKCGRRVLNELICIQKREHILTRLSERHLRIAVFWEMEVQRDWSDDKFTERVNDVLDRLLLSIRQKSLLNYFIPTRNTL